MNTKELNTILREQATELNACHKGMRAWNKDLNRIELIGMYKHFIEFAIDKNFPTNEFIKQEFDPDILHKNGVWVGGEIVSRNYDGVLVLNENTHGLVMQDAFSCAIIHVRHNSDITISCNGMAKVFVYVYDNAKVRVEQADNAKVYVYKKSKDAKINIEGDIVLRT